MFLLDTNIIRELFQFYFDDDVFNIKKKFIFLIHSDKLFSVKEVYNELDRQCSKDSELRKWLKEYKHIFLKPESDVEIDYIKKIYSKRNFQNNVAQKSILKGRPVADPFLVAKAKLKNYTVITSEKQKQNAAKIPNLCDLLIVNCIDRGAFLKILKETIVE